MAGVVNAGMEPAEVARLVLAGIRANRLYIHTHIADKTAVEARMREILEAYDALT